MLADGNADFAKAIGMSMDGSGYGMGLRSQRYSMLVRDGVLRALNLDAPGEVARSGASVILQSL